MLRAFRFLLLYILIKLGSVLLNGLYTAIIYSYTYFPSALVVILNVNM